MADLTQRNEWIFKLDNNEMLLILRALRGALREDEKEEAKSLGDHICVLKAKLIQAQARENEKLVKNLRDAGLMDDPASPAETHR